MTNEENLSRLQARQLELLALMSKSDAHADKCIKEGISYKDTYPDEYAEYIAANTQYNDNEIILVQLRENLEAATDDITEDQID